MLLADPTTPPKLLRRDASERRQRIIDSAAELFLARGMGVALDDIARHAGVGVATLYRNFPQREALVEAVFAAGADKVFLDAVEEAQQLDDGWRGLCRFMERICEVQLTQPGLVDVMVMAMPQGKDYRAVQSVAMAQVARLIERAQAQGTVRADLAPQDLAFVWLSIGALIEATRHVHPDGWRRFLALAMDALRAQAASPLPPSPVTTQDLNAAFGSLRAAVGSRRRR